MQRRAPVLPAVGLTASALVQANPAESMAGTRNNCHGMNGVSPVTVDSDGRMKLESEYAVGWLKDIMADAFA